MVPSILAQRLKQLLCAPPQGSHLETHAMMTVDVLNCQQSSFDAYPSAA